MPLFCDEYTVVLKKTMLQRVPGCMMTKEDIESVQAKTGLSVAQIRTWADNFRHNHQVADRAKFLAQDKDDDQVIA